MVGFYVTTVEPGISHISSQELSKITMPVIFNEPLSFLQRLTEYMEHTYLIHRANASTDSIERMKVITPTVLCTTPCVTELGNVYLDLTLACV